MRSRITAIALAALVTCAFPRPAQGLEPDRGDPDHVRMLVETGVYLLLGTAWYFSGQDLNAPDWDLEITGDDLKLKFLGSSQIRFDNNTFVFNQVHHPLAHGGIYLTGRANDMGPYLAFAYTYFASLFWEYVGELREKVSINDMIVSPMTGMAWGEVAYQYGEYFRSPESRGRTLHRTLTAFVGIPRTFHDWLDDETPTVFDEPRFFPQPRAAALVGVRRYDGRVLQPLATLAIESKLAVMPGFGQPGESRERFRDGNFSSLEGQLHFSGDQLEVDLDATAIVAGVSRRDISLDGNGFEFIVGGARGYRLLSREGEQSSDRVALAHLLGPATRLILHGPGQLRIDIGLDAFFDFTAIKSLAVPRLIERHGEGVLDQIRTDTKKHGYYFGWGFTVSPTISVELRRLRLELSTDISRVHSIQGLDRFEEEITRTIILDDLMFETRAAIVVPAGPRWLDLRLQANSHHRGSQLDDLRVERTHREIQFGLQSQF